MIFLNVLRFLTPLFSGASRPEKIAVTFEDFEVEGGNTISSCPYDFVTLRNKNDPVNGGVRSGILSLSSQFVSYGRLHEYTPWSY